MKKQIVMLATLGMVALTGCSWQSPVARLVKPSLAQPSTAPDVTAVTSLPGVFSANERKADGVRVDLRVHYNYMSDADKKVATDKINLSFKPEGEYGTISAALKSRGFEHVLSKNAQRTTPDVVIDLGRDGFSDPVVMKISAESYTFTQTWDMGELYPTKFDAVIYAMKQVAINFPAPWMGANEPSDSASGL